MSREAFEQWAADKLEMHTQRSGRYTSTITQTAWNAWQAALQSGEPSRAMLEAVTHGTGITKGGKHVPLEDFYVQHSGEPVVTKTQISEAIFGWGLRNDAGHNLSMDDTDEIAEYIVAATKELTEAIDALQALQSGEPVAVRYGFDGYGYLYLDGGSGSDWMTRIPDAEKLYAAPQLENTKPVAYWNRDFISASFIKLADHIEGEPPSGWVPLYTTPQPVPEGYVLVPRAAATEVLRTSSNRGGAWEEIRTAMLSASKEQS